MELLATVVYQTVTNNRPRTWSSHTNINSKNERTFGKSMNSVEELSTYDLNYFKNSTGTRNAITTAATTYDFPEHAPSIKKDRKWSFGNLFRRNKKKDDTDNSSSDEELQKKNNNSFLNRKKHGKCDKRKKPIVKQSIGGAFDHIVPPPVAHHNGRQSHLLNKNGYRVGSSFEDAGILSDPSGCFDAYIGRPLPRPPNTETSHIGSGSSSKQQEKNRSHNSLGSVDSLSKKSRKVRTKARAVARRDSINHANSSGDEEDDSQRSCSSSRFRSDESLVKLQRDGSTSRRSRTARTERYIRRLSKDDESILNREAMQRQARDNWQMNSPATIAALQPTNSRLVTPPQPYRYNNAQYNYNPCANDDLQTQCSQPNFSGLFTIPPSHSNIKYRNSNSHMHINQTYDDVHTSRLSMNQQPSHEASPPSSSQNSTCFNIRSLSCDSNIHKSPSPDEVRIAKRDQQRYRNLSLVEQPRLRKQPPPPPPRDPRRMIYSNTHNHMLAETRPCSQWYPGMKQPPIQQQYRRSQFAGYRTNSEDVIPTFSEKPVSLEIRPASVTNERKTMPNYQGNSLTSLAQQQQNPETFKYMTEKRPRSRKPIFIQSTDRINTNNYNSSPSPQNDWKRPPSSSTSSDTTRKSPQIFTAQTHVQTKIFLPSTLNEVDTVDSAVRQSSPFKPISSPINVPEEKTNNPKPNPREEPNEEIKRKSANLEEALDELEAIYKSLHLGDEDLLERAEQREMSIAAQKLLDSRNETYSGASRGAMSDSSFSYEPFNALDTPKKKVLKKARTLDRKNDDMAFRKMSKDSTKANTINTLANVSYLLASPVHFESMSPKNDDIDEVDGDDHHDDNDDDDTKSSEADITLDDVVYRTVKHANNTLRVVDPQPPFGIPIGPVTPAANSDYLHAVPEHITNYVPYVKNNRIPDIVKDDLAYRNLRKDPNKEPALKPVSPVDFDNNNQLVHNKEKKKRAVRSLSANISNLINVEQNKKYQSSDCENEFRKTRLTDIADAMEIARQILKEKENRIQATKRAFLSDSETKYRRDVTSASSTETITESRLNFLNEMRSLDNNNKLEKPHSPKFLGEHYHLHTKPPRGATPDRRYPTKETTPTPNSPGQQSRKDSLNSSFEELLTALAVEARETSDRITNELNTLDDNLKRRETEQKKLKEIDSVSEHAKLCEKLLECVVESTELIASTKVESTLVEQVEQIENLIPESVANIVTTRIEVEEQLNNPVDIEVHSTASEQDYDNLIGSDLDVDEQQQQHSKSPFEEHKAELVASFQEMKRLSDSDESIKEGGRRPRYRKRKKRRPTPIAMNPSSESSKLEGSTSEDRIARYKEERRRQLREQFKDSATKYKGKDAGGSSSSSSSTEGPRTTRAYRLRVAAAASAANSPETTPSQSNTSSREVHNTSASISGTDSTPTPRTNKLEKDKSSKRKSNLNRSLTCQEVPSSLDTCDEQNSRGGNNRRRRRYARNDMQTSNQSLMSSTDDKLISDTSLLTATNLSPLSSPITTATVSTTATTTTTTTTSNTNKTKKSELSIHMENARKGVTPSYSEMGKYNSNKTRLITSSPMEKSLSLDAKKANNKENIKTRCKTETESSSASSNSLTTTTHHRRDKTKVPNISSERDKTNNSSRCSNNASSIKTTNSKISRRLEELTALTRETLALASSNSQSPPVSARPQPTTNASSSNRTKHAPDINQSVPVSILKRKVSQEETKWVASTPPVTFSPSVIEPAETNRKQGILKKRRSLDESQVLRHRSCSPDLAGKADLTHSTSILKGQRRSSLEEITRLLHADSIQGILKRKTPKHDEDGDNSLNSPQGILKRRSGASSAGSVHNTHQHHVSITTAVILAAAEGAEMVLDPDAVRPILKKKSFSEEGCNSYAFDDLKPILKKKSSTETDENEEKPKRPILKNRSKDVDRDYCSANESGSECDVKPILKFASNCNNNNKEDNPPAARPRLSFCEESFDNEDESKRRSYRRLQHEQLQLNGNRMQSDKEKDRDLMKPRNVSVLQLVKTFENSTGAIPKKKSSMKRNSDRCRTQPVTFNEFEESLNYVRTPRCEGRTSLNLSTNSSVVNNVHSLLDLSSTSLENDMSSSYLPNTMPNVSDDSAAGKMSSDSAFQSLGDGLELMDESNSLKSPKKLEPSKLALQMKAIALEAKNLKLSNFQSGVSKYHRSNATPNSRFSTQPITSAEVDQASKLQHDEDSELVDASCLSIHERVRLFNEKEAAASPKPMCYLTVPKPRTRFNTQPITSEEVEFANNAFIQSVINSFNNLSALDVSAISPDIQITRTPPPFSPTSTTSLKTIKQETLDEGISSNESDDNDENDDIENDKLSRCQSPDSYSNISELRNKIALSPNSLSAIKSSIGHSTSDNTSDESSGGREIQSIIGSDAMGKHKKVMRKTQRHNEYNVQKSRSNTAIGNETESAFKVPKTPSVCGIQKSSTTAAMQSTISELRAKLQHSGDNDWRKRTSKLNNTPEELNLLKAKNIFNEELTEKSILKIRKDELDASAKQWKSRVEKSDADAYSVAGRMQNDDVPLNILTPDKIRRTPSAKKFRGKEGNGNESSSVPVSPDYRSSSGFKRSNSSPVSHDSSSSDSLTPECGRKVSILTPNDETFKSFFRSIETKTVEEHFEVNLDDFDSFPVHTLLVQKKNIQVQKRRGVSKNPLRALAARDDIQNEYTEVITGFAEREAKRLNIEKLAKNSHLSVEALAGLASKEDIKSVALKKASTTSTGLYLPFKGKMLLQIKGRRHVQTRLVEPVAASINEGDNFVLITPTALYNYIGSYSNVIEQSRASDIINHIQQSSDMGCKSDKPIIINAKKGLISKDIDEFWKLLDADNRVEVTKAGHPDEDEVYESGIVDTNMIYTLQGDELVPVEKYWSAMPKIEMLEPSKVFVFDFGTEMYVWSGKNADPEDKKISLKLAKELWDHGYNYTECSICPINVAEMLGARTPTSKDLSAISRPDWALFAKVTQHRETILFREKFLDWPDYTRVIKVKEIDSNDKSATDPIMDQIKPCNVEELLNLKYIEPDFEMEGSHLGRGRFYFDEESRRHYEVNTLDITVWTIFENTYEKIDEEDLGHFYDSDTYIIRWKFRVSVSGRELSGKPSKHLQLGRDRCIFFSWLGEKASINEKGTTALLTVELDSEHAKQIRVIQGAEPPVFLQLFNGNMVIHNGKSDGERAKQRLFVVRGEIECETSLIEVPVSMRSLRSRSSFLYVESKQVIVWHGAQSPDQLKNVTKLLAEHVTTDKHEQFHLCNDVELKIFEEGREDSEFLNRLGEKPQLYYSLKDCKDTYTKTPRLYQFSSITGSFEATEILCPHRSTHTTPYPFLQSDLYSANQPALFLFDNEHELWLWQGWWPEKENDTDASEQTGSGPVRWQAERRAAMQTAIDYWKLEHPDAHTIPAYLVWAGLEPLQFSNLFPIWCDRDDIAELNIKCGINSGDTIPIAKELAVLTRTTYPLAELLQRPLPIGVDPTQLEIYLSPDDFHSLLEMSKEDFHLLPMWKQTALKKDKGLF